MRPTDLADPAWVTETMRSRHRDLGTSRPPAGVDLLDARIQNPHRPDSPRCRGWATVRVTDPAGRGTAAAPVFLLRAGAPEPTAPTGMTLPGLPLRAWRYPEDPGLPALQALIDPRRARSLLPAADGGGRVEDAHVVRWQPGVSATARCVVVGEAGHTVLYAKLLARGDVAVTEAVQRRLFREAAPRLVVAEPAGADVPLGILWTREVVGRPVLPELRGGTVAVDRVAALLGRSLAGLHLATALPPLPRLRPEDVANEAAKKARKIACVAPAHAAAVRRLAADAARCRSSVAPPRPLHGDFHVGQALLTDDDLVLLDLDEMVVGDPALDLAELTVDLGMSGLPASVANGLLEGVAEAYQQHGGTPPVRDVLRGFAAAELMNRCYRRVRRPVPGWREQLAADLAVADDVLAGTDRLAGAALPAGSTRR